jgi:hypothetical protein
MARLRFEDVDVTIEIDQAALLEGVVAFEMRSGGLGIRGAVTPDDAERIADLFIDAANAIRLPLPTEVA